VRHVVRLAENRTEAREVTSGERDELFKVSRRLIAFLFVLYVAAYLDRINIGFAQLQMKGALGFSDTCNTVYVKMPYNSILAFFRLTAQS
jgi:sugar phosphate permease